MMFCNQLFDRFFSLIKRVQNTLYLCLICMLFPSLSNAEPWVDTSNIFLKSNIQLLADAGLISTPVTTYPLMWNDIASSLNQMDQHELTLTQQDAYHYIRHQLKLAKQNITTLELNVGTKDKRFTSFGDTFRGKNNISLSNSYVGDSFAYKIKSTLSSSSVTGKDGQFDGSYLTGYLGNWVFTVGKQDRWWGQGWDSNLSLTNNARPIPAISLTRMSAQPFNIPFTEIDIPWTVTTFMGKMDDERIVKDTLLWGMRVNFKPLNNLEIGVTRLAQWGGKGRSESGKTFWNLFLGKDNCGTEALQCGDDQQEPGNQQAGYDLRYSFQVAGASLGLYGQYFAEDGDNSSSFGFLTETNVQVGIDTHMMLFNKPTHIFLEYIDTYADCRDSDNLDIGDCYYEHHIYQTGMRYNQRTISNLYDNDASSIVAGYMTRLKPNTTLELKLRKLVLNKDNHDKAPNNKLIGNPLTKVKEDLLMLSGKLQHSYKNWRYTLEADVSHSTFIDKTNNDTNVNVYATIEYNL